MITKEFEFENGDQVKEKVTGFKGVVTGTVFYLTGCNQYLVTPKSKNNKEASGVWYDEGRLELVKRKKVKKEKVKADDNGCDILPPTGRGM